MPRIARPPLPSGFRALLTRQHGVFSIAQAAEFGLTRSVIAAQVAARRWQRLGPGVLVAHNAQLDHVGGLWVALLRCGDPGLLSHQTAAHLHGLITVAPANVHVTIPASRRIAAPEGVVLHRTRRPLVAAKNNPSCTSVVDTVLDLADECSSATQLVALVTRTLQRRDVSRASLIASLGDRQRVRWRALLQDLLGVSAQGIESVLEWRFDRDVIKAHGLPALVRQDVVRSGPVTYRRDGVFEAYGLVVELDGRLGHTGDGVFRDMRRDNAAVRRGEAVLRFGWSDVVGRMCDVAVETVAVLRQRGWGGCPRPCSPGCPVR